MLKSGTKFKIMYALLVKLPKHKNSPTGENSANLVTLSLVTGTAFWLNYISHIVNCNSVHLNIKTVVLIN
jgi:hypothetical protein